MGGDLRYFCVVIPLCLNIFFKQKESRIIIKCGELGDDSSKRELRIFETSEVCLVWRFYVVSFFFFLRCCLSLCSVAT